MRIALIGLNELGLSYANIISYYHEIVCFDKSFTDIENEKVRIRHGHKVDLTIAETIEDAVKAQELILVFDVDLLDILNEIVTSEQIVILTSLIENVMDVASQISNCRFVYNPCVTQEKIVLAFEKANWNDGETMADIITIRNFYAPMMKEKPKYHMCTFDTANDL